MIRKWDIYPLSEPLLLPKEAEIIFVGNQRGLPVVWTNDTVPATRDAHDYQVQIFGTGHTPPLTAEHVGTTQMPSGFVWHVFRLMP